MYDQAEKLRDRLSKQQKQGKTIAVVSGKGGVGKSNTALNFSLELQRAGKRVLLFDLDVGMGNIDILIGNDAKYTIANLFNEFIPLHDIIELGPLDLSYVAGGTSLNEFICLDEQKLNYFYEQYNKIVKKYDYILFDLGAGVSQGSMSFILASDECFVVTTPEPTALTDAYSMIKHIFLKQSKMPISIIMNRCSNSKEGNQLLDKFNQVINQFLQQDIKKLGMLPNDQTVSKAVIRQTPYVIYDQYAAISRAMKQIVSNFLQQSDRVNEIKRLSFIERLKNYLTTR
ncbi:MAG TPA: MinD/ParA family protein [Pseudogracilibacillus sp.]|nr:MinD/ParA family protein [Pseudogracilibacillus sp.]